MIGIDYCVTGTPIGPDTIKDNISAIDSYQQTGTDRPCDTPLVVFVVAIVIIAIVIVMVIVTFDGAVIPPLPQ